MPWVSIKPVILCNCSVKIRPFFTNISVMLIKIVCLAMVQAQAPPDHAERVTSGLTERRSWKFIPNRGKGLEGRKRHKGPKWLRKIMSANAS